MKSLVVCLFVGIVLSAVQLLPAAPQQGRDGSGRPKGGQGEFGGPGGPGGQGGRPQSGHGGKGGPGGGPGGSGGQGGMLEKLMAMDTNGDGALTPSEVTDPRLQAMLKAADTDSSGSVTFAELAAAGSNAGVAGGRGMNGPGQGGQGQGMHPPRPGEVMPGFVQDQLQLTDAQRQQLADLQTQVDAQLAQILTAQQLQMLASGPQGPPMGGGDGPQGNGQNATGRKSRKSKQ